MQFTFPRRILNFLRIKPNLHFLHIGKSGGLNIASNFITVDERGSSNLMPLWKRLFLKRYFIYIRHLDVPWAFRHLSNLIFVIRDPIERMCSAFYYLIGNEANRKHNQLNEIEQQIVRNFLNFNDFIEALRKKDSIHHDLAKSAFYPNSGYQHFWMNYEFYFHSPEAVEEASRRILYVGHINEYDEFTRQTSLLMGVNIKKRSTNSTKMVSHPLTRENREYLNLILKSEYLIYDALMKLRE